jgi:hypothetical protein
MNNVLDIFTCIFCIYEYIESERIPSLDIIVYLYHLYEITYILYINIMMHYLCNLFRNISHDKLTSYDND